MKAKSLSVFRTQLWPDGEFVLVRLGDAVDGDEGRIDALARNGLVKILDDCEAGGAVEEVQMPGSGLPPVKTKRKK